MKRKDIVKIDNQEVVLNSPKEFSEFKKRYNKYNFMQKNQINTWETELKRPELDTSPEPTNREIMAILLEMKKNFEERFNRIEARLDKHDEIFRRNNLI